MLVIRRPATFKICGLIVGVLLWISFFPYKYPRLGELAVGQQQGNPNHEQLETSKTSKPSNDIIPKKIWYKLGPKGLTKKYQEWTHSCISRNPGYQVEMLTDESAERYVAQNFASHPRLLEAYKSVTVPILKADLIRYLLLYREGGVWLDLDITCDVIPIDNWVPPEFKSNASLVVGWEFDTGWRGPIIRQFASWTIMAKPGVPHLWQVIEDAVEGIHEEAQAWGVPIGELNMSMIPDVVDFTGPRRLTTGVFKSLARTLNRTIDIDGELAELRKPRLMADVLIMPGFSFADLMNRYGDNEKIGPMLVHHNYAGSWKNDNGGESV